MKKFLLSLSVLLLFAVSVFCGEWDGYFVVLHTNDIHGRAYSSENYWGYAGIKRAKDYFEKQGADVFLADAGDFSQGTPLVNLSKGKNAVDFMNRAGYNAAALGNHEFDWGIDSLLNNLEKSRFKVLCCNILRASDNEPIFETNMVFETKSGKKVGVFGVDTPECAVKVHPGKITGLRFLGEKDMYNEAQKQIAELKNKNCSFIICLGHLGDSDESYLNRSIDLIDNTRGINLFVDGHSHTKLEKGVWQNNTFRVSAGEFSKNIGCVIYKETEQGFEFKEYLFSSPEKGFSELFSPLYDEKLKKYIDNINAE
ncbi:MAG: metallophosphatase, partial [Armatimonadetes bacterium]|nr:metallophosphatase [Candidatus Hippobium faecium]